MITHLVGCILVIEFNQSILLLKQGMLVGTIISNKKILKHLIFHIKLESFQAKDTSMVLLFTILFFRGHLSYKQIYYNP